MASSLSNSPGKDQPPQSNAGAHVSYWALGSGNQFNHFGQGELITSIPFRPTTKSFRPLSYEKNDIKPLVASPVDIEEGSLYQRISERGQFRLLEILPGVDGAMVQCRLHVCFIRDNCDAYEALSYCWKIESRRNILPHHLKQPEIECNGIRVEVGDNVHLALRRLRYKDSSRIVWVDAICINQSDVVERNQQVGMMGGIYGRAHRILVWLGAECRELDKDGETVYPVARNAFSSICSVISTWATKKQLTTEIGQPQYRVRGMAQGGEDNEPQAGKEHDWHTAISLYHNRWFGRLWVLQEIVLARQATVIWGDCEISWQWIGLAAAIIRTNWQDILPKYNQVGKYRDRQVPVGVANAYLMYRISLPENYFGILRLSFCKLLALTRQFKCQEKHDKIFGLLGLPTTDQVNKMITVDYTQSLDELYHCVALAIMSSEQPLEILSHVHHSFADDSCDQNASFSCSQSTLPTSSQKSWVPVWDRKCPQPLMPLDGNPFFAAGYPLFAAGYSHSALIQDIERTRTGGALTVRGIIFGYVTQKECVTPQHLNSDVSGYSTSSGQNVATSEIEQQSWALGKILSQNCYTQSDLMNLALNLCAGKNWYGTPITSQGDLLADFANCLTTGRLWWTLEKNSLVSRVDEKGVEAQVSGNQANHERAPPGKSWVSMRELEEIATHGKSDLFLDAVAAACTGRCLLSTDSALRGVGPYGTRPGDKLCIINGVGVPFIIRQCKEGQGYTLVGECYVQGVMQAEAFAKKPEQVWIKLV